MSRSLTLVTIAAALAVPAPAFACGGFFCSSSPIEQAGETIVYGMEEDGSITMSVQIRYAGDDDDFAWILPVPAPPEIGIGSDALFDALHAATAPAFVIDQRSEGICRDHPTCYASDSCAEIYDTSGCGFSSGAGPEPWMGDYVDAAASRPPPALRDGGAPGPDEFDDGVTVYSQGPVGPYETVVLGAASAEEVLTWLADHDYDIPSSSAPILDAYARAGHIFVALRLSSNRDTRFIQPVTLRMPIDEACLPIRLTAIASVENLPITTFFLGSERVAPRNFSLAEPETSDVRLFDGSADWGTEKRDAIDALGGQAFVTEYAGPTPALSLTLPSVDDLATETDPSVFIQALNDRGYRGDVRLLELFRVHLVPPAGREEVTYYNCLSRDSTASCGEPSHYDPAGLARDIDAVVTAPRADAEALVHRHGYLTRLWTSMHVEQMTIDPVFASDPGLADVSNVHRASYVTDCNGDYYAESAPTHWEIDGDVIDDEPGAPADDAAYCAHLGGRLDPPDCSDERASSGGCLCGVAGVAPIQGGVLGGFALLFLARRIRRRRG